ncbi:transcription factor Adf-1-like [Gymnodraco acuticeps]|uniref:Transcription factor Adf-1-like n=1 Tax=Gymnodraco acuticeps TaxID=8218 RepID=A0A6P8U2G8_GYMAC|nr:transcription factor Adf-1-like [Gymnodraco acuticeps]XP_034076584.1 transcription factor Adf-1-like [Gymnodraco acuticeps]
MDEVIIVAVANHPVLFDVTLFTYRDRNQRNQAWKEVAETVGETDEVCKKRWKSLRDRYRRERILEKEGKSSGAGASGGSKPWRLAAVMSFLKPFMLDRETSSNFPRQPLPPPTGAEEEEDSMGDSLDDSLESQPEPGSSQPASQPASVPASVPDGVPDGVPASVPAFRGKKSRGREMSPFEENLLSAVGPMLAMPPPPPPPPPVVEVEDEDLLFLRSLWPAMQKLSRTSSMRLKMKLQEAVLEATEMDINN